MDDAMPTRPEEILQPKQLRRLVAVQEAAEILRSSRSVGPAVADGAVGYVDVSLLAEYILHGDKES